MLRRACSSAAAEVTDTHMHIGVIGTLNVLRVCGDTIRCWTTPVIHTVMI